MTAKVYFTTLTSAVIALCPLVLLSQAPDTIWTKTFGGSSDDQAWEIQRTSDGGYISAGLTSSFGAGNRDFYLVKTDSAGNLLWWKTFGGTEHDNARSVVETSDKGFIVVGITASYGVGEKDCYLIKVDSLGDSLWARTFGGVGWEQGYCVRETFDGGFIITGVTHTYGAGDADVYLIKTNYFGNTEWATTFGGANADRGLCIAQTYDGGYIIVGNTESFGGGYTDLYMIRTDSLGDSLWTKVYGASGDDRAYSVQETSDGRYIVVGYTTSFGSGLSDIWLLKAYTTGDTIWTKKFGGIDEEWAYCVKETSDDGYIISGFTYTMGAGGADLYLVRTDVNGNMLWQKTVGGASHERGYSVVPTANGGYACTGYTESYGSGGKDLYLVKIAPDPQGIKEEDLSNSDRGFLTCCPNPTGKIAMVRFSVSEKAHVDIGVYNMLGQKIGQIVSQNMDQGEYSIQWNAGSISEKEVPGGVYFIHAKIGGFDAVEKLILVE